MLLSLKYWKNERLLFFIKILIELMTDFSEVKHRGQKAGETYSSVGKALSIQAWRPEFKSPESTQSWTQSRASVISVVLWKDRRQKQKSPEACRQHSCKQESLSQRNEHPNLSADRHISSVTYTYLDPLLTHTLNSRAHTCTHNIPHTHTDTELQALSEDKTDRQAGRQVDK